ncbi:YegS/Rv2252/BmrU family lipid kinase [Intestinibacter bartlettii]|uniref:YegS/Rv2252/BmrU family lipid kinase n=1 Tax=Intestinibacter bartlettii TaxID=261299 RepID=UPI0006BF96F7|nr:YegS/Rv2252/BmrU family lipid kinase [Intestinibacter bartlettii]CUO74621.1 putative lipid kinase [Intestinibacter bartlettii]
MKKVKFIYNPNSGDKRIKNEIDTIIQIYQAYDYCVVPYRLTKTRPNEDAFWDIDDNYDHVLLSGGDGTIDLLINIIKKLEIDIPIGILPSGTANDFANAINYPHDVKKCIEKIISSKPKYVDIGKINDRYFINVASAGMFTDVSQKINPDFKNTIGKVSYYIKGIEEALNMRQFKIKVTSDEMNYDGDMYLMLVFNGKSAGNINLAYKAEIDDGYLDVIIVKGMPIPKTLPLLINILKGEHLEGYNENEILFFKTRKVTIECEDKLGTDIDGEKGPDFPLTIECIKDGIQLLGYE